MRAVETAIAHAETYPARADEYGPTLRAMIDSGRRLSAVEYQTFVKQRLEFTGSLRRVFQDVEIVLMPSSGLGSPTLEAMRNLGQDAEFYASIGSAHRAFQRERQPCAMSTRRRHAARNSARGPVHRP